MEMSAPSTSSPLSNTTETMKEAEEAGERGGENVLEGVSRPGAGNTSESSQQAKQDSLTPEHRSLAGHQDTVRLW